MRGDDLQQAGMFSYLSPEQRVPQNHPLRSIRKIADAVFVELSPQFDKMYARMGRPSIAPEKLLRALLLQVLYSVRSERLLMGRVTLGGDKNYDTHDFVKDLRELEVTPHVAQNNTNRRSAIDGRTTRGLSNQSTEAQTD